MRHTRLPTNIPNMQTHPQLQVAVRLLQWDVPPGRDTQKHVSRRPPKHY